MKDQLSIYYDEEADFLELRIGEPTESYFEDLGDDLFERRDEKNKAIRGFAIFNFKKRAQNLKDIKINLPVKIELIS